jgi:phosphocarrier protein FPr/phosphocarrier protein
MLGDGLAIDPVAGVVCAPCDGVIVTVAKGGHAVGLRASEGVEVLIHVGIDTVQLSGKGFEVLVKDGQGVSAGQELLRFDLDGIARAAKSVMTPVVVTPNEKMKILWRHAPGLVAAGDLLLEVGTEAHAPLLANVYAPPTGAVTRTVAVMLEHGIHARPAAQIAKRVAAVAGDVTITAHGKTASARSVTAMMALGIVHGDDVTVTGAPAAVEDIVAALSEGSVRKGPKPIVVAAKSSSSSPDELAGVTAVPGFAVGRVARIEKRELPVVEAGRGVAHESAEFERARTLVRGRLSRVGDVGGATRREIVATHLAYLDDPQLNEVAQEKMAGGKSAGFAWRSAVRGSVAALQSLKDARLRERVDDLLDIESHVLLALAGEARPMKLSLPAGSVLVADELLPSELVSLDRDHVVAICLAAGGRTSHVAILAAAMDLPMLIGLGPRLREVPNDSRVIVDGEKGVLRLSPSAAALQDAEARVKAYRAQLATERTNAQQECRTLDGTRVEVFANLGSVADAEAAVAAGAEGCGLLRTEFLFIDRDTAPSEAEQLAVYQDVVNALGGRPLVLRLMDVGGDKPLKYLPLPAEENPALGLRGIRTALRHPDLLRTQLRAALQVKPAGVVRILLPMVTDASEVQSVRSVIDELRDELGVSTAVEVGAMIETPAAALTASAVASFADFLSIGSNDLTQYTLAMDRGHPELAPRIDALHPAVLKLIALAAEAGTARQKLVAVCGGIAADRLAVPLLIGLGVRELSVVPAAIPALKRQIRQLTVAQCKALALRSLELSSAEEVRSLVSSGVAP